MTDIFAKIREETADIAHAFVATKVPTNHAVQSVSSTYYRLGKPSVTTISAKETNKSFL